jgi:hypothetical protein
LNPEVWFPDNARKSGPTRFLMRLEDSRTPPRPAGTEWPRRVLVGLWALAFVVGGGVLSARWDVLMARLARPPVGDVAAGGTLR